ncbi:type II toxin-antitoxin system HicB family antitoxin [Nodosilinea sp. PGN35]|uniref:type II toxin-antitoxin system HicB family antitoxin n=1 Tax=Nodosilinea sp. PGN35 TaxID=3020489 RepID=UPI0023B2F1DB|nr:type II toxin-antitoxin system HicB family antitoxin [Nodosilinea sp. TSF1-S3]MDF0364781.1 type II toxin-antitoxin system HicB family antitoxin [Nodosilinea sp. TSF1-S3]
MSNPTSTSFTIETEQEEEGRWIAEILEIPGALVYGASQQQAVAQVKALALRVIADKLEHGEIDLGLASFI